MADSETLQTFAFLFYGVKTIEASCPGLPVKFPELALWKERPTRRLESVWVGGIFRAGFCFFPRFGKLFGFPAVSEPTSEPRISKMKCSLRLCALTVER